MHDKMPNMRGSDDRGEGARWGDEPPVHLRELPGGLVIVQGPPIPLRRRFRSVSSRTNDSGVSQTSQVNLLED
jgi:hypothetical protein